MSEEIACLGSQEVLFAGLPVGTLEDSTPQIAVPYPDARVTVLRHALVLQVCDGFRAVQAGAHAPARCVILHGAPASGKTTLAISASKYLHARGRAGDGVWVVRAMGCTSVEELAWATLWELKRSPVGGLAGAARAIVPDDPRDAADPSNLETLLTVLAHAECLLILDDVDGADGDAHERAAAAFASAVGSCAGVRLMFTTRRASSAAWVFGVSVSLPESLSMEEIGQVFAMALKCVVCDSPVLFGGGFYANADENHVAAVTRHVSGFGELLTVSPRVVAELAGVVATAPVTERREFIDDAPDVRKRLLGVALRQAANVLSELESARERVMIAFRRRPLPKAMVEPTAWYTCTAADDALHDVFWPAPPRLRSTFTPSVVALSGVGGVGKTLRAMRYAADADAAGLYPGGVFWLGDGTLDDDVKHGVLTTAGLEEHRDQEDAEVLRDALRRWLASAPPWLLIAHNSVDVLGAVFGCSAAGVFGDLAAHGRGHIIITTRLGPRELMPRLPGVHVLDALPLGDSDAATLLLRRACVGVDVAGLETAVGELLAAAGARPCARALLSRLRGTDVEDAWVAAQATAFQALVGPRGVLGGLPRNLELAGADVARCHGEGFARYLGERTSAPPAGMLAPVPPPPPTLERQLAPHGLAPFAAALRAEGVASLDDVTRLDAEGRLQTEALKDAGFRAVQLNKLRVAASGRC
jgi:hypothetical protein